MLRYFRALRPSKESIISYIRLLAWVVALSLFETFFGTIGDAIFIPTIIHLSFVYLLLNVAFDSAARLINFWYRKKHKLSERYIDGSTLGITRLSRVLIIVIFVLFVVDVFVPIKTLLGSLTIAIAVGGLAFRDQVINFMGGVSIMFSGDFQLGEYVQIGLVKGKIRDMSFTYIQLETEMQNIIFVPNSMAFSREVINFSKNKLKNIYIRMVVDRANYKYYRELQEHIALCANERYGNIVISPNGVKIRVESFEKDSVSWLIEYRVSRYDFELETLLKNFTADTVVTFLTEREAVAEPLKTELG
jgi:small-conductance mechanosensitive channel